MDEREPDLDQDPREETIGEGGYPERNPAGPGDGGKADERDTSGAPAESAPQEGDAQQATGNPGAAG
jgi:hypothetical protein